MKQFAYCFIILCVLVGLSVQTNNCCTGATPLSVLPFSSIGAVTSAAVQLDITPNHIDASITAGAWFTFNHLLPLSISLDICALNDLELTAYLFHGSCDNLVIVDVHHQCCGSLLDINIIAGRNYYLFIGAPAEVDISLNLNILSPVLNSLCINPAPILNSLTCGSTLGVIPSLLARDVAVNTCDVWYFLHSALNNVLTLSTCPVFGGSADIDATIRVYTGACNALTLVATLDIDCANVLTNHLTIHLDVNTIYYVVVSTNGIYGDFNLFSSVVTGILPAISLDALVDLDGNAVICSAQNNILRVTGNAVVGLTYELTVGNLEPIIFECTDGAFEILVDISALATGDIPVCLLERGTGRLINKSIVNEILSVISDVVDDVASLLGNSHNPLGGLFH